MPISSEAEKMESGKYLAQGLPKTSQLHKWVESSFHVPCKFYRLLLSMCTKDALFIDTASFNIRTVVADHQTRIPACIHDEHLIIRLRAVK